MEINGKTFSGHSFRTTIGNTLNSLIYMWDHLRMIGVSDPWKSDLVKVRAQGDDVIVFAMKELLILLKARVELMTVIDPMMDV